MLSMYLTIRNFVSARFPRDERGATAVEYGLMVSLIAAVIILAVTAVGLDVKATFEDVADALPGVP